MGQVMTQIKQASLDNITMSVWNVSYSNLDVQMNGIISINDVVEVKVTDELGKVTSKTKENLEPIWLEHHKLPLIYKDIESEGAKKSKEIGQLEIWLTLDHMYYRLFKKMVYFFVTQFIKTLLASVIMFLIFNYFIFRHIVVIDKFFENIRSKSLSSIKALISLPFKEHEVNEITRLRDRINEMITRLQKHESELKKELESAKNSNFNLNESQSRLNLIVNLGEETEASLDSLSNTIDSINESLKEKKSEEARELDLAKSDLALIKSNIERVNLILTGHKRETNKKRTFESILTSCQESRPLSKSNLDIKISSDDSAREECHFPWLDVVMSNLIQRCSRDIDNNGSIFIKFTSDSENYIIEVWNKISDPIKNDALQADSEKIQDLGLNSCKTMISQVAGTFLLDESYAEGTKFKVSLPRNFQALKMPVNI